VTVAAGESTHLAAVLVAIPARNESTSIGRCLASIDQAAAHCRAPVHVVVAADSCHDGTAAAARDHPTSHLTVRVVEGQWRGAGRARAAAIRSAFGHGYPDDATTWIANTDADCVVDVNWLGRQVHHATQGACAVAGVVALDGATTPTNLLAKFAADYRVGGRTHHHVHAANFGIRADVYRLVGGWSEHTVVGEEHDLWRRLNGADLPLRQPPDLRVTTSSRTASRVPGGFATYLARLQRADPGRAEAAS